MSIELLFGREWSVENQVDQYLAYAEATALLRRIVAEVNAFDGYYRPSSYRAYIHGFFGTISKAQILRTFLPPNEEGLNQLENIFYIDWNNTVLLEGFWL